MKAKKIISMILALTMILSMMTTLNVSAARTKSIDVNDSVSGSFYYDEEDDDIKVPSSIPKEMKKEYKEIKREHKEIEKKIFDFGKNTHSKIQLSNFATVSRRNARNSSRNSGRRSANSTVLFKNPLLLPIS